MSLVNSVSYAVGSCFAVVAVGAGTVGGFCLAQSVKVNAVYKQCCGEDNQYNTQSPCPGGGLKERAEFCSEKHHSTDSYQKAGYILLASAIALISLSGICWVVSSKCKRRGYQSV
ncbi:MAG: hypothetical protein LLG04_01535 [Parachlamydia sp.]|nr:hypothetical protein [Parachlamydia sp.]